MPLHPFEIQKYYENEPKFNGVYSRNNLSKIKDGAYIINLDEYESLETHWIALYVNDNDRHLFFYKQLIFVPRPENCLSISKKSP